MSKDTEHKSCELTGKVCDKNCELWADCPLEKHDVSDYIFIDSVIRYVKKKYKKKYKKKMKLERK